MELVGTLMASMGGTAAAGTAAAGTAATGATVGSSLLTTAQVLGSAFTAVSTIGAGFAANNQAKDAAAYEDFQAKDKKIKGDLEAAEIRKTLALTMQKNKVAMAAGGVDLGSITATEVKAQVAKDAETQLGMSHLNTQREVLAHAAEKRRLKVAGRSKLITSLFAAGGGFAGDMAEIYARG